MTTHSETRVLPYTAQQMYDLVADVERYPEFLPWTAAARIRSVEELGDHAEMLADLVVSFKLFRESFGSRVRLFPREKRIETAYIDGPFRKMDSVWRFRDVPGGVEVRFDTDFEFRSRLLQKAAGVFFYQAMQQIVRAFEKRAAQLYGVRSTA
ncbi:type II toxin-antitoxin system RatA family toxin [Rubellimicrobium roseum]|uniref:Type II toxin-antitoxin system RatA family toxin n=1 Tax=Rubellimicrobium roseum TaxID=687525 RepID=A0A5C4NDH0_9RHOB|nr:type II toxin-antitoxin system RatA family toxin [Rubellimicrobium roseum]TNC71970.1 type II toxin-antitoxin system RatA family toxin [Rubellimicrobium roseum]